MLLKELFEGNCYAGGKLRNGTFFFLSFSFLNLFNYYYYYDYYSLLKLTFHPRVDMFIIVTIS